jgi:hypothetical protein
MIFCSCSQSSRLCFDLFFVITFLIPVGSWHSVWSSTRLHDRALVVAETEPREYLGGRTPPAASATSGESWPGMGGGRCTWDGTTNGRRRVFSRVGKFSRGGRSPLETPRAGGVELARGKATRSSWSMRGYVWMIETREELEMSDDEILLLCDESKVCKCRYLEWQHNWAKTMAVIFSFSLTAFNIFYIVAEY